MAHLVTAPAIQRARRLLDQRVTPTILSGGINFTVHTTEEWFEPPSFEVATSSTLSDFGIGGKWGLPWHTRWFRLTAVVPPHLADVDLVAHIDLGFSGRGDGFQVEALAWHGGRIVHAVQPDRRMVHLGRATAGHDIELWVEAAATPIIAGHEYGYGPTSFGDPSTAPSRPIYSLRTAQLARFHHDVHSFAVALHAVIDLTVDMQEDNPQRARLFAALERCGNAFDVNDPYTSMSAASDELQSVLRRKGSPHAHRIVATGHAHLDTAWLWPIRETRRKAVRTFANAVELLRRNPDVVYCHSQAQHYAWVADDAPEIFSEVVSLVQAGRWEPVGGMWVETDLNLPSGESLLRQLVQGQRAFRAWFGTTCNGAFLPDDFGYPAGLPQIVRHGGCRWFFSQKLSWNETNRFPHHSFWWEGIDGTEVLAHFSPVDTYNALMTPSQLRFAERNYADHAGSSSSLVLYGHGDGGGGPTQTMIDRARLAADWEGVPRVRFGRVDDFFADLVREYGSDAPRWVGEMYFEKHRGTYSTQVGTKQGNRLSERLLHDVELWSATAGRRPDGIDQLWRRVLTQQFHDIIPGSSIAWVHDDAESEHRDVANECDDIIAQLLPLGRKKETWVANSAPVAVSCVVTDDEGPCWADVAPFDVAPVSRVLPSDISPVVALRAESGIVVSNGIVTLVVADDGTIVELSHDGRNVIPFDSAARLVLLPDTPAEYDAWDIDRADADAAPVQIRAASAPRLVLESPMRATVECRFAFGNSTFILTYSLDAGSHRIDIEVNADWNESERRLQWVLPTDLLARDAVCGTQFGHVRRPRHTNTSWDVARFEVCAHRYVAVHEPGFGVAVLADGPRGYDVRGDALKLTLLRAPRFPDPEADRGRRTVSWSVRPTTGDPVREGIEEEAAMLGHTQRILPGPPVCTPLGLRLDVPGALVSAVKPADDGSGDLVVRIWESRGGRTSGTLSVPGTTSARRCDALEDPVSDSGGLEGPDYRVSLRPFEIVTLRLTR